MTPRESSKWPTAAAAVSNATDVVTVGASWRLSGADQTNFVSAGAKTMTEDRNFKPAVRLQSEPRILRSWWLDRLNRYVAEEQVLSEWTRVAGRPK
jgi:hypothetical protein